mmetsp:Transcript_102804/g.219888  ORF Transcript_102804/g.219888 Transcript_102804/m.219888 type:complete len:242 (+) Transcript_102804:843-1568(+)
MGVPLAVNAPRAFTPRGGGASGARLLEAASARACADRTHKGAHTTCHVDDTAARKVHVANLVDVAILCTPRQPTIAPSPADHDRVDEGRHEEGIDAVAREAHALRHTSADNGGGSRAKGPLEEPRQHLAPVVIGGLVPLTILLQETRRKELPAAYELVFYEAVLEGSPISESPTGEPPPEGANTDVHQVLEQDVLHIFRTASTCFEHCETALHEHYERAAQEQPDAVRCRRRAGPWVDDRR